MERKDEDEELNSLRLAALESLRRPRNGSTCDKRRPRDGRGFSASGRGVFRGPSFGKYHNRSNFAQHNQRSNLIMVQPMGRVEEEANMSSPSSCSQASTTSNKREFRDKNPEASISERRILPGRFSRLEKEEDEDEEDEDESDLSQSEQETDKCDSLGQLSADNSLNGFEMKDFETLPEPTLEANKESIIKPENALMSDLKKISHQKNGETLQENGDKKEPKSAPISPINGKIKLNPKRNDEEALERRRQKFGASREESGPSLASANAKKAELPSNFTRIRSRRSSRGERCDQTNGERKEGKERRKRCKRSKGIKSHAESHSKARVTSSRKPLVVKEALDSQDAAEGRQSKRLKSLVVFKQESLGNQ